MRTRTLIAALSLLLGGTFVTEPSAPATAQDRATCAGRPVTIDLNDPDAPSPDRPRADVVLGTPGADEIRTGAGNDVFCGRRGTDVVDGGTGDDLLIGGRGPDWLNFRDATGPVTVDLRIEGSQDTGLGRDTLRGFPNLLGSRTAPNYVIGTSDKNKIKGGALDDYIEGRAEADRMWGGGQGDDVIRGGEGRDYVEAGRGDDSVTGGAGPDHLLGGYGLDVVDGGTGDDRLQASTAPAGTVDQMLGGPGADVLGATEHDERVDGGDGQDIVWYHLSGGRAAVTVDLSVTGPQDTDGGGTDELIGIEGVVGTLQDDLLLGDEGDNILDGWAGDDTIDGRGGHDVCASDPFADTFTSCEETYDFLPHRHHGFDIRRTATR